jgi:predicted NAD/FAD-binding protein
MTNDIGSADQTLKTPPASLAARPSLTPRWFRRLALTWSVFVWMVILALTFVVWAFRVPDEGKSHLPIWWAVEFLVGVSVLLVGRSWFWKLVDAKYRWLTNKWGLGVTLAALGLAALLIVPGWTRSGAPVTAPQGRRVAIVGAGTAGLHAAWMLKHAGIDFVVYEAADYLGGHAYAPVYTPEVGKPFACDVGFIFGSPTDYQEMKALMEWYGVQRNESELSMSGQVDGKQWASGPDVGAEAIRFQELAEQQHKDPKWNLVPFGFWLTLHGFNQEFREQYITPLMSVLFITDLGLYEVSTRFMLNMAAGRIQWVDFRKGAPAWTVKGGSGLYYERLTQGFRDHIRLKTPVSKVTRAGGKVLVEAFDKDGKRTQETFDDVILAVPGDVAAGLVKEKDWLEDFVLGQIRYQDAEVVLHTDDSFLPKQPYLRHYNYYKDQAKFGDEFELTGVMNWVHGAGEMSPRPIGTLNPLHPIAEDKVIHRRGWRHHAMDLWHLALVLEVLPKIQGRGGVWYAGDWVTVIGHGPAMRTGMAAACQVGAKSKIRPAAPEARCIDVRVEEERAGLPAVDKHLCGEEEIFAYLVERNCNGFKL